MRKVVAISALSVLAAGSVAVGVYQLRSPHESMTADLERDLSLANSVPQTRSGVVSALEQGRMGAPSGSAKGVRLAVPTKKPAASAAPSQTVAEVPAAPTVEAPEPAPNAPPTAGPVTTSPTPAPSSSTAVDAYPPDISYPTPAPTVGGPSAGNGNDGDRGNGSGTVGRGDEGHRGSGPTGVIGAILRGGMAGHDNCEPAGRRSPRPGETGMPGAIGTIGGIIVSGGGMPTGSIPGGPRSGGRARW